MTTETIEVQPDVARISEGLRDTGYEFNTAIADIIDNSIAAGASNVDVRFGADFIGNISVSVADDGCGMDRDGLINAMKYGSKRRADAASLGKFGLGLKTASTAFCKRLALVSRPDGQSAALRAAWDLDFLGQSNSWGLELASAAPHEVQLLNESAQEKSGTVVIWEKVDRLLSDYTRPDGKPLKNALKRQEDSLREHIATVYQRFLDPTDARSRTLTIKLNGAPVSAWDPFCIAEVSAPAVDKTIPVQLPNGQSATFSIRAFILPRKEEFSSTENRNAAKISNERQGVYVYRENRLIHGPDWLGMRKQRQHFQLWRRKL